MKHTCLSKGRGFHFPPCHVVNVCGFRILVDCPLDLSALTIFAPVVTEPYSVLDEECSIDGADDSESVARKKQKVEKPLDAKSLIHAEPWYKTVKNLHLWNASFIDVVLISSPMGMLALPFLTRMAGFSAKIYVTGVAARVGQLMMEDLLSMHMEFRQLYGPGECGFPQWMNLEKLESFPMPLREISFGKNGEELGAWMPLYSAADVKNCMAKLHKLRFAEEACYNGTLIIKAASSGLEIGACNWTIKGPKRSLSYISGSVFVSGHAMDFDYRALRGNDLILYSDFSFMESIQEAEVDNNSSCLINADSSNASDEIHSEDLSKSLLNNDENLEEMEKLAFICSCAIDTVKDGGSVLIPMSRIGNFLQVLEQMSVFLESSTQKVPIYIISSVAEELLSFANIIPEWLCNQRQEKMFSGESLFAHEKLIKDGKIRVFPAVHSTELLLNWQEPCIVFSPHWSLRLGPTVHLLHRWCQDEKSLLVLENEVNADIALLPFKPMSMKVLQCSFLSGIRMWKIQPLLKMLQPKMVMMPEDLRPHISFSSKSSVSVLRYSDKETLRIPSLTDSSEIEIHTKASQIKSRKLKQENTKISRLEGDLTMYHGRYQLFPRQKPSTKRTRTLRWGSLDLEKLLSALSKVGINGSVEQSMDDGDGDGDGDCKNVGIIRIHDPDEARLELHATHTVVSTTDEKLTSRIFKAIDSMLDGI